MALLCLVPPGQVLSGGDLPYCSPLSGAMTTLRCGAQIGYSPDQLVSVLGGQFARLVQREDPHDLGPAPGDGASHIGILLERAYVAVLSAIEPLQRREDADQPLRIARQACRVPDDHEAAPALAAVAALLASTSNARRSSSRLSGVGPAGGGSRNLQFSEC